MTDETMRPTYQVPNPTGRPPWDQGSRGSPDWKLWQEQGRTAEAWDRMNNGGIGDSSLENPVVNCSPFSVGPSGDTGRVKY